MKYIKAYEGINDTAINFKPGNIVKIIPDTDYIDEIKNFLNNNIGEIYNIEHNKYGLDYYFYNIRYDNVPNKLHKYTRYMGSIPEGDLKTQGEIFTAVDDNVRLATPEEIKEHKIKIDANKFNL